MKKVKIEDKIFIFIIILIMLGGTLKPLILPHDVNYFENRKANQIPQFQFSDFLNKTYQNNIENALSDQIPLSNTMKSYINSLQIIFNIGYYKMVSLYDTNKYNPLNDEVNLYKKYLVFKNTNLDYEKPLLDNRINNINKIKEEFPEIDMYLYYIERDYDINFETNEKVGIYEYIKDNINSKIKSNKLEIKNFDEYKNYFYKTDHHWNYKGSYEGYLQISDLMKIKSIIKPTKEICFQNQFKGSKSYLLGTIFNVNEKICAYSFNLEKHTTMINNKIIETYYNPEKFINNLNLQITYDELYGSQYGLVQFDYNKPENKNLLIIGNSYDNHISELIASNYNRTYVIDLRNFENDIGEKFNIKKFINEKKIDEILFIGDLGFYHGDEFNIEEEI